jgi:hypothetical protein
MSVRMRDEDQCEQCTRAARFGSLCTPCFMSASPERRAVETLDWVQKAGNVSMTCPDTIPEWMTTGSDKP